jgi:hypothetical protein
LAVFFMSNPYIPWNIPLKKKRKLTEKPALQHACCLDINFPFFDFNDSDILQWIRSGKGSTRDNYVAT